MSQQVDGSKRSWRIEKMAPVVAEGLEGLADLETTLKQGADFDALPIYMELFCAHPRLTIGKHTYTLGTTRVVVRIVLENCEIISRYDGLTIQTGSVNFETEVNKLTATQKSSSKGFNLSGQLDLTSAQIVGGGLFGLLHSKRKSDSSLETNHLAPEITIISTNGIDGFAYGDFHFGDPRRPKGLLYDVYRCLPGGGSGETEEHPLITVRPLDESKRLGIKLYSYVPTDRLWVSGDNKPSTGSAAITSVRHDVEDRVERLRTQMIEREFGERASAQQQKDGWPAKDGEFIVYVTALAIHPPEYAA